MVGLDFAGITDVHVFADKAHIPGSTKRAGLANSTLDTWMFCLVLPLAQLFLLHRDWDLLLNLSLDHLNEELLVIGVHTTSALAPAAWVRSTLLGLTTVAPEAWDSLRLLGLVHELLVLEGQLLDLSLVSPYIGSLLCHQRGETLKHLLALAELHG